MFEVIQWMFLIAMAVDVSRHPNRIKQLEQVLMEQAPRAGFLSTGERFAFGRFRKVSNSPNKPFRRPLTAKAAARSCCDKSCGNFAQTWMRPAE
jgi:hypothetical protein